MNEKNREVLIDIKCADETYEEFLNDKMLFTHEEVIKMFEIDA